MNWHYVVGSEQRGPVSEADLDALQRKGLINGATLVWFAGMDNWKEYRSVRSTISSEAVPQTDSNFVTCAISGKKVSPDSAVFIEGSWISAECKDLALQCIREGVAFGSSTRYAGFWMRFTAVFIDGIVLNIFSTPIMFLFGMLISMLGIKPDGLQIVIGLLMMLISIIVSASYEIFLIGKTGATVGKMVCGIKVVEPDGKPIGYAKSAGRFFAKALSFIILCIGYIMAVFDDERRTLHDRLCETRVVYK